MITPTKNYVAVKPDPLSDTSQAGLYIGAMPTPMHRTGDVMAVGDECDTVKAGDKIMYMPKRAVNAEGVHIINEIDDIICIIEKEAV